MVEYLDEKKNTDLVRKLVEHSADIDIVAKYRVTGIHAVPTFLLAAWNEASVSENRSSNNTERNFAVSQYQTD